MNTRAMMRSVVLSAVFFATRTLLATTYTVPSSYDEATQTWIGDVTGENGLTNSLRQAKDGDVVVLSKGVYDLTDLAANDFVMRKGDSSTQNCAVGSVISAMAENVTLKGATGDPADVLIKADNNTKYRLYHSAKNGKVYHVTMTGGNASSTYCGAYNYRSGGAIGFASGTVVSNCVFYGNKAGRHGGAVGYGNSKAGTVWNCVFYGNNGSSTGCVGAYTTFHNCVISNNQVAAGSGYSNGVLQECNVYDCFFTNNAANGCGGVFGGNIYNSRFVDNHDRSTNYGNPGGGAAHGCTVISNCYFYGNTTDRLGGAIRGGKIYDSVIVSNSLRRASGTDSCGGGVYAATLVSGCTVVSNYCRGVGGGLYSVGFVTNSVISYNYAGDGGGAMAYCATNADLVIEHNNTGCKGSDSYSGCYYRCRFRDNFYSADNVLLLDGCDVADGYVSCRTNLNCVFHELNNQYVHVWASNNVARAEGFTNRTVLIAINALRLMRNCVVTNCYWPSMGGDYYNTALMGNIVGRVENCTIADNCAYWMTRHVESGVGGVFVNCALVRNRVNPNGS